MVCFLEFTFRHIRIGLTGENHSCFLGPYSEYYVPLKVCIYFSKNLWSYSDYKNFNCTKEKLHNFFEFEDVVFICYIYGISCKYFSVYNLLVNTLINLIMITVFFI